MNPGGAQAVQVMDPRALAYILRRHGVLVNLVGMVDVADGQGGYTRTVANKLTNVLAVVNTPGLNAWERFAQGMEAAEVTHHCLLAYAAGVSVKDRLVVVGSPNRRPLEVRRVVDPLEAHEILILLAFEVQQ